MSRPDEIRAIQTVYEALMTFELRERVRIVTSAACLAGCISQERMAELIRDLLTAPTRAEVQSTTKETR